MSKRSRYFGIECLHCSKPVKNGLVALCSTYYAYTDSAGNPMVTTARPIRYRGGERRVPEAIRIVYHRRCLERILSDAPLDPKEEAGLFEEYRDKLVREYYGDDDDDEGEER